MKLSDKYRPTTLSDIIGQFKVNHLRRLVARPYSSCWCLLGPPGTGKTATAAAVAHDLDCHEEMTGYFRVTASELGIDAARELFDHRLKLRPFSPQGWKVLVIEELELLSQQTQIFLKVALENLPSKTVVIATSNGVSKLQPALVERFTQIEYSSGEFFASAVTRKLRDIWSVEVGGEPPSDIDRWGWSGDRYSARIALGKLQQLVDTKQVHPATIRSSQS